MASSVSPALTLRSGSKDHELPCDVNVEQKVDGMIISGRSCFHFFFSLNEKKNAEVRLVWVTCHFCGLPVISLLNALISSPALERHIHSNKMKSGLSLIRKKCGRRTWSSVN